MRYSDASGHWELWDDVRGEWVDLDTADTNTAHSSVRLYMERPHGWENVPLMSYINYRT